MTEVEKRNDVRLYCAHTPEMRLGCVRVECPLICLKIKLIEPDFCVLSLV